MGEQLNLQSEPADFGIDRTLLAANLRLSPEARLNRGASLAALVKRNRGAARS